ncbi:MAG: class I SAM-dependent methyltransferase [Gaiellaceae bacterium]
MDPLAAVLDPADASGGKNRLIHRVQLRALSASLRSVRDEHVLDFGCGTGRISAWLVRNGAAVEGVDVTAEMVDVARANVSGASFRVADGSSLPFEDARFDVVVSVFVLQYYVTRDESVVRELTRVLRSGGRLVAIEQIAEGDIGRGASATAYEEAFNLAGLRVRDHSLIRASHSPLVRAAARLPALSLLPFVPALVMAEARSSRQPLTDGRYADAIFEAVKYR